MKVFGRLIRVALLALAGSMAVSAALAVRRKQEAPPPSDPADDEIELVVIFEELDFPSTATAFRGGRVECWFGGGTLDLRGATLHPDGAVLELQAVFGGGSILVPPGWNITTSVAGLGGLGGVGEPGGVETAIDGPSLHIEATSFFGGWGIIGEDGRG